jgi:C_GCAxxG_C_C family probable redox protein
MDRIETTVALMKPGKINCAQAILRAFGQAYGIDTADAMTLGRPWGGGLASSGGMCGFVSGAVIVLAKAFDHADEALARQRVTYGVKELLRRFQERCDELQCKELLGADIGTEPGRQRIAAEKLFEKRCPLFGRAAAEILEQLLQAAKIKKRP